MAKTLEGVPLVREVIKLVKKRGFVDTFGASNVDKEIDPKPVPPEVLEKLALHAGVPLTPCIREWLAFDSAFFEWFDDGFVLRERKLPELIADWPAERGMGCLPLARTVITRECYGVPFGDETMRFVYPSEPDSIGELPVMLLDVDDMPALLVGYPGVDVYLGYHAGLLEDGWEERFGERMRHHQKTVLRGQESVEYGDEELFPEMDEGDMEGMA